MDFDNYSKKEISIVIGVVLALIICLVVIFVFVNRKARSNGASWVQIITGKSIGKTCASNGMCKSNKCQYNLCVL